jgi:glycosyltransferase involved in cell wall biosynthesis
VILPMPTPVPVLLLVRELNQGGCERDLTKIALRLDRSRFQPHVACFRPEGMRRPELDAADVPVLYLPVRSFLSHTAVSGGLMLRDYIRRHGIRLVHCFDVPMSVFAPLWARLAGVPAIITSQLSYRSLTPREFRLGLRFTDRLADRIVVNCEAMWRHMTADEGCPEEKLFLCYNGVETEVFHPGPRELPSELGNASVVIGCVCALRREKRLDLLIRAFSKVRGAAPWAKLAIVGSGAELPRLEEMVGKLGLTGYVVFQLATPEVPRWLRAMDIFVLASDSEAFSNSLLEAMACGCCPVGSKVGGTPELILEKQCGLIFPPGDESALTECLLTLIERTELREKFGKAAAVRAREHFCMKTATERISALYSELLDSV